MCPDIIVTKLKQTATSIFLELPNPYLKTVKEELHQPENVYPYDNRITRLHVT